MLKILITCEHGGNWLPKAYRHLFIEHSELLNSHRGYDIGALALAKALAPIAHFTQFSKTSRLLIELNRSLHHPKLFSQITRSLPIKTKQTIIKKFYLPYREALTQQIQQYVKAGYFVLHISVHSFTPELNGEIRNADVGFLYDPSRSNEKHFCKIWRKHLQETSLLRLRNNYPYLGKSDGLPCYFRKLFTNQNYAAIELETNQALWQQSKTSQKWLHKLLFNTLATALVKFE